MMIDDVLAGLAAMLGAGLLAYILSLVAAADIQNDGPLSQMWGWITDKMRWIDDLADGVAAGIDTIAAAVSRGAEHFHRR